MIFNDDNQILHISITPTGVQIVIGIPINLPRRSYQKGNPMWDFLLTLANKRFVNIPEIRGKSLVSVDVQGKQSQFSWK